MKLFTTVAQMKLSNLTVDQTVETQGYSTVGDLQGARYLIAASQVVDETLSHTLANGNVALIQGVYNIRGNGSPEGVIVADIGSTYQRADGGAGTSFYVKESGNGLNTGWVAK